MAQTTVSVVIEVQPLAAGLLRSLISGLNTKETRAVLRAVTSLHFVSMTVFADQRYDPTFVLEANFDGPAGPFWADLEAAIGPDLHAIIRCCKCPRGLVGKKFDAVTAAGARLPIAPLLEALAVRPVALHQGNRGRSRPQIEREAQLFLDVRKAMRNPRRFRGCSVEQVHQALRRELLPRHPWLAGAASPPLIGRFERLKDLVLAGGFAVAIVIALNLPGVLLSWISTPPRAAAIIAFVALILASVFVWNVARKGWSLKREGSTPGRPDPRRAVRRLRKVALFVFAAAVIIVVAEVVLAGIITALRTLFGLPLRELFNWPLSKPLGWPGHAMAALQDYVQHTWPAHIQAALPRDRSAALGATLLGLAGAIPTLAYIVMRLRMLEDRDPSQRTPEIDARMEREIAAREDRVAQNHMGSLVHLKPGLLRSILMHAGLLGLGLAIRANPRAADDGYLVTVRTIHFAHLSLVGNGSRLMFQANFDGTWDNYLTDFTEKVHAYLTLVWTSGVGFPATRYLVLDGATHGRLFKKWKRRAMAPSLLWFSAYPALSVEQIRRQADIADGLRKKKLTRPEAAKWAMCL